MHLIKKVEVLIYEYWNGQHRIDGPVEQLFVLDDNGNYYLHSEKWMYKSQLHRDGNLPAVTVDGKFEYYHHGDKYNMINFLTKDNL